MDKKITKLQKITLLLIALVYVTICLIITVYLLLIKVSSLQAELMEKEKVLIYIGGIVDLLNYNSIGALSLILYGSTARGQMEFKRIAQLPNNKQRLSSLYGALKSSLVMNGIDVNNKLYKENISNLIKTSQTAGSKGILTDLAFEYYMDHSSTIDFILYFLIFFFIIGLYYLLCDVIEATITNKENGENE